MTTRTVTTMEELKKAKGENVEKIIVEGMLSENLVKSRKVATLSAASLAALTAAIATAAASIAAAPVTGGLFAIAAPASLAVIVALLKGYTIEANLKNSRVTFYRK